MGTVALQKEVSVRDDLRVESITLDFAKINRSSADVLKLFNVYAGETVHNVVVDVETAEGGTATAEIGDTAVDPNGFVEAVNLNSAVISSQMKPPVITQGTPSTIVPAYGLGKTYAAADTIDMLLNNNMDAALVHVGITIARAPIRYA